MDLYGEPVARHDSVRTEREIEMHDVYLTLANDTARERICEAARWRLANEGRRAAAGHDRPGRVTRLRSYLAGRLRQPALTATLSPDTCEGA